MHSKNKLAKEFYLRNGLIRAKELDRGPTSSCFVKKLKAGSPWGFLGPSSNA
jgi:hypothetical protein